MKVFGDTMRAACPVCDATSPAPTWLIPFTKLPEPIVVAGGRAHELPLLDEDATVYAWSRCVVCRSIFLNPFDRAQKDAYRQSDYPVRRAKDESTGPIYQRRFLSWIAPWLRDSDRVFVEAACGHAPYSAYALNTRPRQWSRLVGLELSRPAVAWLREKRPAPIEAHEVDVDADGAVAAAVADASADVVVFSEAFEHVERPAAAVGALARALRPGGRLLFTAQATEGRLPVRPGEPVYTSRAGLDLVIARAALRSLKTELSAGRWKVVAERVG